MHWRTGKSMDNLMSDESGSDDSDVSVEDQDISDDDEENSTNVSTSSSSDDEIPVKRLKAPALVSAAGSSSQRNEDEEDSIDSDADEVTRAILNAKKLHRNHPPSITLEDMITDICFHPKENTIAVASITGDVLLYSYNNEETNLVSTVELHLKACRDIEFSEDGQSLFSTGKDLCIAITDVETRKLIRVYEGVHEQPIYTMTIINEHVFATGDDDGVVKLWDLRRHENEPIFSIKEAEHYISAMITNRDAKYLVCASGDGLTTINIPERKLHVQSEEHDDDLTCLGLFKCESKLLSASNKGKMYVYNWGEFGLHSDEFPSVTKKAINCMVPITENVVITGDEDGTVRATSLFPHHQLGVVGQHDSSVEALDINNDGTLIASSSHDNDIKFWNVQYFETLNVNEPKKGGKRKWLEHNLPSSQVNNRSDFFAEL